MFSAALRCGLIEATTAGTPRNNDTLFSGNYSARFSMISHIEP